MTCMKAVVSGGTGFIGRRLCQKLVARGVEVIVLTRRAHVEFPVAGAAYERVDFARREDAERRSGSFEGADAFFHIASSVTWKTEFSHDGFAALQEEVTHPLVFLDALGDSLRKVVFASSIMVYPLFSDSKLGEYRDEDPSNFYGVNKLAFETGGVAWAKDKRRLFVSARIGQAYGPQMRVNRILPDTIDKARRSESVTVFGDGSACLDWIYIEDVVEGLIRCADYDGSGLFNLGTGVGTTNLELVESVIRMLGSTSEVRLAAERLTAPQRQIMDGERARVHLGFVPQFSFPEGLAAMLAGS